MPDRNDLPAPTDALVLTHFLTVRDVARFRDFYADIFGAQVMLEENPAIVKIANGWIILNPGGGPTPDKPDITLTARDSAGCPATTATRCPRRPCPLHRNTRGRTADVCGARSEGR